MRRITICLLGPLEVSVDATLVTTFAYAKVRALLAYLAVESDRPHSREQLATLLWPEQPNRVARASLSQALSTLRNALGDKAAARPALLSDAQSVQLDSQEGLTVDVAQFLSLLHVSDAHQHHSWRSCAPCAARLRQAMALYRGHFLADLSVSDSAVFEEWASLQREFLLQRALSTLGRLMEWAQQRGAVHGSVLKSVKRDSLSISPFAQVVALGVGLWILLKCWSGYSGCWCCLHCSWRRA